MRLKIKSVKSTGRYTQVRLEDGVSVNLRPFIYIRKGDTLEFIPSVDDFTEVNKVFEDRGTGELKSVKIHPAYAKKETVYIDPYKFEVTFRERIDSKDWEQVKGLEQFHYRGKGLNKVVGRRTVLLAEVENYGVVGFGVLSATLAVAKPRFSFLNTNFKKQMQTKLINQIVRIPRVVIHPEFRGMNLGVLMAKHLVEYAKEYWDINHYSPVMVEVIAAMIEYHKFFQRAGFVEIGSTLGYKGNGVVPKYGRGSFEARSNVGSYDFMQNQRPKPYLVYPLSTKIEQKMAKLDKDPLKSPNILTKSPRLARAIRFENVSAKFKVQNGATKRTALIKEAFGIDVEHAFSPVIQDFCLQIDPGDVVLIAGASGTGKSTVLRLLTSIRSALKKEIIFKGKIIGLDLKEIAILDPHAKSSLPLIEQIRKNGNIKAAIELLNSVGLAEAHLYIKRTNQISDGQRYRFAVAKLCDSGKPLWIADEFASTLNGEMAAIVAKGLRRIAYKHGATLILAAPHIHNFVGSLMPNKIVRLKWGAKPLVYSIRADSPNVDVTKVSVSFTNNGDQPLTNVHVGFIKLSGEFVSNAHFVAMNPKQSVSVDFSQIDNVVYALAAKTREGVGDIILIG